GQKTKTDRFFLKLTVDAQLTNFPPSSLDPRSEESRQRMSCWWAWCADCFCRPVSNLELERF
ncbi:hypothetical protein CHARACLAT_031202, partial [Characodon lateralis]|nr:hypothetical protein [Characodon lateralis]